jgi:two-component system, NarL family, response regulator DevR
MPTDATASVRILLIEDHQMVRMGIQMILEDEPTFQVVGEAATVEQGVRLAREVDPDVILMDIRLPDGSGIEACREIMSQDSTQQVLFLTSTGDEEGLMSAVMAGAKGYLLKNIEPDALIQAIDAVAVGQTILEPSVKARVKEWIKTQRVPVNEPLTSLLTLQQYRVIELVAEGFTNKEIAEQMKLSERTVRNYLTAIYERLNISRRSQAATFFGKTVLTS